MEPSGDAGSLALCALSAWGHFCDRALVFNKDCRHVLCTAHHKQVVTAVALLGLLEPTAHVEPGATICQPHACVDPEVLACYQPKQRGVRAHHRHVPHSHLGKMTTRVTMTKQPVAM